MLVAQNVGIGQELERERQGPAQLGLVVRPAHVSQGWLEWKLSSNLHR